MYVGATRQQNPEKRIQNHGRRPGWKFNAVWAPSNDIRADEQVLLNAAAGQPGNLNKHRNSNVKNVPGWTYAAYPAAPGA